MYADTMRSRQQDYSSQMQHCFFMHEDLVYVDNNSYVVVIYSEIASCENEKSCCQSLKHYRHFFDIDMLVTQAHVKSIRKCLTSN
jgi:hypothetical protein